MLLIFSHFLAPLKITTIRRSKLNFLHFLRQTVMQKRELAHFRSSAFVFFFRLEAGIKRRSNELFTSETHLERDKWEKETISIEIIGFISAKEIVDSLMSLLSVCHSLIRFLKCYEINVQWEFFCFSESIKGKLRETKARWKSSQKSICRQHHRPRRLIKTNNYFHETLLTSLT